MSEKHYIAAWPRDLIPNRMELALRFLRVHNIITEQEREVLHVRVVKYAEREYRPTTPPEKTLGQKLSEVLPESDLYEPECESCGESHRPDVMCPPHEVRRGTGPHSRKVVTMTKCVHCGDRMLYSQRYPTGYCLCPGTVEPTAQWEPSSIQ